MGYLHIDNLYKIPDLLTRYPRLYALEKIHGTSAHVSFDGSELKFFGGGMKHEEFVAIFNTVSLEASFRRKNIHATVYGEAYGGKCQKMSLTYGTQLKFVAFDVKVGDLWLTVPEAERFAYDLGIDFVYYNEIDSTLENANAERDRPSTQAKRNGIAENKISEGVILRPIIEETLKSGKRVICKHKHASFCETKTPREVDPNKIQVLEDARKVADEWVTQMRLTHVLDKLPGAGIEETGTVIRAMLEDIKREGTGEIIWTKETDRHIGQATAKMFKGRLNAL